MKDENVNHPKHYTQGKIECWDYIIDHKLGYLEGNIVKYVTRYKDKNGIEDLLKAKAYLEKLISAETGSHEISSCKKEMFIARDKDGELNFFADEPTKGYENWYCTRSLADNSLKFVELEGVQYDDESAKRCVIEVKVLDNVRSKD